MQKAKFIGALVGTIIGFRGGSLWNVFFYAWLGAWLGGLVAGKFAAPRADASASARPQPRRFAETPRTKALRTLGLPPTATREQAHAAYRALARQYHPDALRAAGADAETVARATKTMARLNAAWDVLKG